jgi:hypothetical protein
MRNIAEQRNISSTSEPAEVKSDFVRMRQLVYYRTTQPEGTIVVDKPQTFLYVVRQSLRVTLQHWRRRQCTTLSNLPCCAQEAAGRETVALGSRVLYLDKDAIVTVSSSDDSVRGLYPAHR